MQLAVSSSTCGWPMAYWWEHFWELHVHRWDKMLIFLQFPQLGLLHRGKEDEKGRWISSGEQKPRDLQVTPSGWPQQHPSRRAVLGTHWFRTDAGDPWSKWPYWLPWVHRALRASPQLTAKRQDKGDVLCFSTLIERLLHRVPIIYGSVSMNSAVPHFSVLTPAEPHNTTLTVQPGAPLHRTHLPNCSRDHKATLNHGRGSSFISISALDY